jgi:hypothetical protein
MISKVASVLKAGQASAGHSGAAGAQVQLHPGHAAQTSAGHAGSVTSAQVSDGHAWHSAEPLPFAKMPAVTPEIKLRPRALSAAAASASSTPPKTMRGLRGAGHAH